MESLIKPARTYRRLSFVENVFSYAGSVLALRPWDTEGFVEIDLHLPGTDMRHWTESTHIKCKVASFTYRDYSPAFWDADTFTCSLLVDTGHRGNGARWAAQLQAGEAVHYLKIGSSKQALPEKGRGILLGDATAAGHFAGMRQVHGARALTMGAIEWKSDRHCREFSRYFSSVGLDAMEQKPAPGDALVEWLHRFQPREDDVYYLAGGVKLVTRVRKWLKENGVSGRQINAQAFWR